MSKTFLVIKRRKKASICSLFLQVLDHLCDCERDSLIPIVDFTSHDLLCYDERYGSNVWEYFFEPVSEYTLEDVGKEDKVKTASSMAMPQNLHYYLGKASEVKTYVSKFRKRKLPKFDKQYRAQFAGLIKKYIRLKDSLEQEIQQIVNESMGDNKTIALFVRGSSKTWNKIDGKMTPLEYYLKRAEYHLSARNASRIYLICDNWEAMPYFEKAFGDQMFYNRTFMRYPYYQHGADLPWDEPGFGPTDEQQKGTLCKQNLIETVLMSKCDFLIHAESNMAISALMFNDKMDHEFIL